jgi:hypothetical protein
MNEAPTPTVIVDALEDKPAEGCMLGRELGDCTLRDLCGSLCDVMQFLMPLWHGHYYITGQLASDKETQARLHRLDLSAWASFEAAGKAQEYDGYEFVVNEHDPYAEIYHDTFGNTTKVGAHLFGKRFATADRADKEVPF